MTTHYAYLTDHALSVVQTSSNDPTRLSLKVGLLELGEFEGATDALSEQGWEQTSEWVAGPLHGGSWICTVEPVPAMSEMERARRTDLAVRLASEDERDGETRDIRSRVESGVAFDREFGERLS